MPITQKDTSEKKSCAINSPAQSVDILIIGGGLIGATLAIALAGKGYSLLMIDANSFQEKTVSSFDSRSLALSPASVRILKGLDIWSLFESDSTPIESIHVSEQFRFGATRLEAAEKQPLGYVTEIQAIYNGLLKRIESDYLLAPAQVLSLERNKGEVTVQIENEKIKIQAQMIVAADGTHSFLRSYSGLEAKIKDYRQLAITANIGLARSHQNRAYERFTSSGPLAFLPLNHNRAALVWASSPEEITRLSELEEKAFLQELQQAFGYKLGKFNQLGKRTLFPLKQVIMPKPIAWPFVFIGNAAQTLHPIAGQGFNLGLRDVASLAQCILTHGINEEMFREYERMRQHDQKTITLLTDNLVSIFTSRFPGISLLRNVGLVTMDLFPMLKNKLTQYASGFGTEPCDLVCNLPLPLRGGERNED